MAEKLYILMQSSDFYAPSCGVALLSLFQNNVDIEEIMVYLISDNMGDENRLKIEKLAEDYKRKIIIFDGKKIDDVLTQRGLRTYHGTYTAYYKLFASMFIQENIGRLIYLDSDFIAIGSLKQLLEIDMQNCTLAMAIDCTSEVYKKIIKCKEKYYYNSGVVVFNWSKWKEGKYEEAILKHLAEIRNDYSLVDQDLLNLVVGNQIACLDLRYNFHIDCLNFPSASLMKRTFGIKNYYTEEQFRKSTGNPIIYHFCASAAVSRPWYIGSENPLNNMWNSYLLKSPWNNYKRCPENISVLHKIQRVLYKRLPSKIFAFLNRSCTNVIIIIREIKYQIFAKR